MVAFDGLEATPHITQDGSVLMAIRAENNQPDPSNTGANGQPAIQRKEATTQVLVKDGDTTVIGGIFVRRGSTGHNGPAILSHIPILGFFFKNGATPHFVAGTASNLDLPKNWAPVRALVTCTDVETILLDTRVQRLLYKYAAGIGEDPAWLDRVFHFARGSKSAIVKHVAGHRNHYHVRFYNPVAQELGRRVHPMLVELQLVEPPVYTVRHVVRPGQTIGQLAARYGTSVRAIKSANGLWRRAAGDPGDGDPRVARGLP